MNGIKQGTNSVNKAYLGTNAHYWLDKLPQVVTKDNDEYLSLNYGVLGTVCALSVSKYVK
jgi:hypothetical protein